RLPTEAEWEYACRGGAATYTVFHCGNTLTAAQANFDGNHPYGVVERGPNRSITSVVGSYPPSAWGLYDMHGNVWEWTADWYAPDGAGRSTVPEVLEGERKRVVRGGSFYVPARACRAAQRDK